MLITIKMAFRALSANVLRTGLSVLGIIIGISCVIALMSIGEGQKQEMMKVFEYFGTNRVSVWPGGGRGRMGFRSTAQTQQRNVRFKMHDIEFLRENAKSIKSISPEAGTNGRVKYLSNALQTSINGVTPEAFEIDNRTIEEGRIITYEDVAAEARVVVLGYKAWENLFGTKSPLGEAVLIEGKAFEVVGVLQEKGAFSSRWNPDEDVFIPITTVQRSIIGDDNIRSFTLTTWNVQDTTAAEQEVADILGRRLNLPLGEETEYIGIWNSGERQQESEAAAKAIRIFLMIVAAIALLIGGIGIMNIMIVSVTERTREIGLRKALGARKGTILLQFLVESLIICLIGAGFGIILGVGITKSLTRLPEEYQFPIPVLQPEFIILAAGISVVIALIFGIFPAVRAANLRPIEALRYE